MTCAICQGGKRWQRDRHLVVLAFGSCSRRRPIAAQQISEVAHFCPTLPSELSRVHRCVRAWCSSNRRRLSCGTTVAVLGQHAVGPPGVSDDDAIV